MSKHEARDDGKENYIIVKERKRNDHVVRKRETGTDEGWLTYVSKHLILIL